MKNDNTPSAPRGGSKKNNALFVSALKEAVRQYPDYFYVTGQLDELDSMWDMQPDFGRLESLLLENEATQEFIVAVWSFFRPITLGRSGFAECTRAMDGWQKQILSQMLVNDPVGAEPSPTPRFNPEIG